MFLKAYRHSNLNDSLISLQFCDAFDLLRRTDNAMKGTEREVLKPSSNHCSNSDKELDLGQYFLPIISNSIFSRIRS